LHHRTSDDCQRERAEADSPDEALLARAQQRFEEERVSQKTEKAANVAGAIEEVGVTCRWVLYAGKPVLQERRRGRDSEERECDCAGQEHEQPEAW
jgi:hypothetical protein